MGRVETVTLVLAMCVRDTELVGRVPPQIFCFIDVRRKTTT